MKKIFCLFYVSTALVLAAFSGCTNFADIEAKLTATNYQGTTNVTVTVTASNTNVLIQTVVYEPIPTSVWVYVDSGSHLGWTAPELFWWNDTGSGALDVLSNFNDGYVDWWVFRLTNVNMRKQYGLKVRDGSDWSNPEPIKTENGSLYDRLVNFRLLSKSTSTSVTDVSGATSTNTVSLTHGTYDKLYVYPPANWYESYPYFYETETNLFRDPPGTNSSYLWAQTLGANYWGSGVTFFTFYAPNVRRVYVAGDFNDWTPQPMDLGTGRVFWWTVLSNTEPGQAYKFAVEKYDSTNLHWCSDPAAKKNKYSPAMDTAENFSYLVDQSAYTWHDGTWNRPGFEYYTIYQIHVRTFSTNGPGDYYGHGTFITATNRFQYLYDLGMTAVEPLPINEFAGDQSWGYNYTLFYAPETAYCGTNYASVDPLKVFVDAAHQKGIAVILDLVFNHMGASDDVVGSIDPAQDWNDPQTYWYSGSTSWGPAFNYANPVIKKFLTDSAIYLLNNYHIDGLRFDATYYICYNNSSSTGGSFLYDMTRSIHNAVSGNVLLIAENLPNYDWITGDCGFNFQWQSGMASELKKLFYDGTTSFSVGTVAGYLTAGSQVQYLSSHDEVANGKERPAADILVRSWGTSAYDAQCQTITGLATVLMGQARPMLFMGDEMLEGYYSDNATWFDDGVNLVWNNEISGRDEAEYTRKAVADLAWLRRNHGAINGYNLYVHVANDSGKVIGFERYKTDGSENYYVIINYSKNTYNPYGSMPFPSADTWNLVFACPSAVYGYGSFDSYLTSSVSGSTSHDIGIPEYGVLVYKKQ